MSQQKRIDLLKKSNIKKMEENINRNEGLLDVLNQVNAIFSLVILVIGILGNILSSAICLRPKLRKIPTFIFYAFLLFVDVFTVCIWNVDHYLLTFHNTQIEWNGMYSCKIAIAK